MKNFNLLYAMLFSLITSHHAIAVEKTYSVDMSYNTLFGAMYSVNSSAVKALPTLLENELVDSGLKDQFQEYNPKTTYHLGEYPIGIIKDDFAKTISQSVKYEDHRGEHDASFVLNIARNALPDSDAYKSSLLDSTAAIYPSADGNSLYFSYCAVIPYIDLDFDSTSFNYAYGSYDTIHCEKGKYGLPRCGKATGYLDTTVTIRPGSFFLGTSYVCPIIKINIEGKTVTTTVIDTTVAPGFAHFQLPEVDFDSGGLSGILLDILEFGIDFVTDFANVTITLVSLVGDQPTSFFASISNQSDLFNVAMSDAFAGSALSTTPSSDNFKKSALEDSRVNLLLESKAKNSFGGGVVSSFVPFFTPSDSTACSYQFPLTAANKSPSTVKTSDPKWWQYYSQDPTKDASGCRIRALIKAWIPDDATGSVDNYIRCNLKNIEAGINYVSATDCSSATAGFKKYLANTFKDLKSTITVTKSYKQITSWGKTSTSGPYFSNSCSFNNRITRTMINNLRTSLNYYSYIVGDIDDLCGKNSIMTCGPSPAGCVSSARPASARPAARRK